MNRPVRPLRPSPFAPIILIVASRSFTLDSFPQTEYLLARGRDAEAIQVIAKIAAFNRQPAPTLTLADFERLDVEYATSDDSISKRSAAEEDVDRVQARTAKDVLWKAAMKFKHLKGLFKTK